MTQKFNRLAVALLALIVMTGCGSTARNKELAGKTFGDGRTTVNAGKTTDAANPSDTPVVGSDGAGTGAPGAASQTGTPNSGGSTPGKTGATAPGAGGPGASTGSKAPVKIGFLYVKGAEQAYKAIGLDLSVGDGVKQTAAVADWVNKNGGLDGHPIELVPAATTVGGNRSQEGQAACSTWTEDNKVAAAFGSSANTVLNACMTQKRVPLIGFTNNPFTTRDWAQYRYVVGSTALAAESAAQSTIDYGKSVGYFTHAPEDIEPQVALGVVYYDLPEQRRVVNDIITPQARAAGATKVVALAVKYPNSQSEASDTLSQLQNAQLRFKSEHVSHVWILDDGGNLTFNFPQMAESNGYRPRYIFNTFNLVGIEQQYVPAIQMRRAVGIGWAPPGDVTKDKDPGGSQQRKLCDSIYAAKGMSANWGGEGFIAYGYCDDLLLLKRAVDSTKTFDADTVMRTIRSFGSLDSAITFGQGYGADKAWSVVNYRGFAWDTGCSCFAFVGGPRPVK